MTIENKFEKWSCTMLAVRMLIIDPRVFVFYA
jgi:hypothetical protein